MLANGRQSTLDCLRLFWQLYVINHRENARSFTKEQLATLQKILLHNCDYGKDHRLLKLINMFHQIQAYQNHMDRILVISQRPKKVIVYYK